MGANGSGAVLSMVKGSPGTIGCLELSYAKAAGVPVASIQNRAGEFVVPSPQSASLALNASLDALARDIRTPLVDPPAAAKGAYSITGMSFILIPKDSKDVDGEQAATRDYLAYALSTGQDVAEELSYATSADSSAAKPGATVAADPKRPAAQVKIGLSKSIAPGLPAYGNYDSPQNADRPTTRPDHR